MTGLTTHELAAEFARISHANKRHNQDADTAARLFLVDLLGTLDYHSPRDQNARDMARAIESVLPHLASRGQTPDEVAP